ncbi:MAG: hypothetical protein WBV53_01330 [Solirubrobacterales bacterium]
MRLLSLGGWVALIAIALIPTGSAMASPVPLAQVGSGGSGAGQLNIPQDVAIDGDGNLYVADINIHRVDVFSGDGTFTRAFGWGVDTGAAALQSCTTASTCQAGIPGGGAGQLNAPRGIAVDGAGNVYVAEQNNHRISVFNAAGAFKYAFGRGVDTGASTFEVCTTASTCQAGTQGAGAGELNTPVGVAVAAGSIYVSDQANQRISVFAAAGPSFTRAFGWGVDTGTSAFEVCTTASTCQAGTQGAGAGQLAFPQYLTVDAGVLYVAEQGNHRISVFDAAGPSFLRAFGRGVDTGASTFEVCTTASTCQAGTQGAGAGEFSFTRGVALDGADHLYVSEGGNSRISVFDTAGPSFTRAFGWGVDTGAAAFEVCTAATTCETGSPGPGVGQLGQPLGVAIDCEGAAWVADSSNNRLQRFGEPGTPPCTPPPASTPAPIPASIGPTGPTGPTGRRAAALRKCKQQYKKRLRKKRTHHALTKPVKKKLKKKRGKCIRRAKKLPV